MPKLKGLSDGNISCGLPIETISQRIRDTFGADQWMRLSLLMNFTT